MRQLWEQERPDTILGDPRLKILSSTLGSVPAALPVPVFSHTMWRMIMLSEQEIQDNMRSVAHAVAQQELEGLKVPEATLADLYRVARGEIDTNEVIRNIYLRFQNVPLLRQ